MSSLEKNKVVVGNIEYKDFANGSMQLFSLLMRKYGPKVIQTDSVRTVLGRYGNFSEGSPYLQVRMMSLNFITDLLKSARKMNLKVSSDSSIIMVGLDLFIQNLDDLAHDGVLALSIRGLGLILKVLQPQITDEKAHIIKTAFLALAEELHTTPNTLIRILTYHSLLQGFLNHPYIMKHHQQVLEDVLKFPTLMLTFSFELTKSSTRSLIKIYENNWNNYFDDIENMKALHKALESERIILDNYRQGRNQEDYIVHKNKVNELRDNNKQTKQNNQEDQANDKEKDLKRKLKVDLQKLIKELTEMLSS
eukprot:TRINITY_DN4168_c0_g6_i2.p1 TRINITY_DN4168_c0_g6~~TRINITY_DN4168_c0_g6_i2.p1  ORF type:complete len:307 (-),score=38.71 TRINITY_DN4168_c0_g6_i2:116-1036(-)